MPENDFTVYCIRGINDFGLNTTFEKKRTKCKPLLIGSIYRPQYSSLDTYLADFENQLQKVDHSKSEIALMGDFNVDLLSKSRPKGFSQPVRGFLLSNDFD